MDKLLSIEVALLLLLVIGSIFVRAGILHGGAQTMDNGDINPSQTEQTPSADAPSYPPPTETEPAPTETEPPPIKLTFGEGFELGAADYFVYDCAEENLMAISGDLDEKVYPASVTKLFTAYVALQYLDPGAELKLGREVNMVAADSSLAYLKNGQRITVSRLVEGMLLPSGNDAAYAIAVAAARAKSGNSSMSASDALEYFVDMMNDTAQKEGMTGSHFANPDGYHDFEHYTTCGDLITIARLALSNDVIREHAGTYEDQFKFSNGSLATWHNTNALINPDSQYYHPDAVGLKTGHTGYAGFCVLTAFELDGDYIIIGSFGCQRPEDRFLDALKLYDLVVDAKAE